MKKIIFILVLFLLLSSCRIPESIMAEYDSNPFLDRKEIRVENPTLIFFTDAHIGRERNKNDVIRYDENFLSFIEEGGYEVVISGGDMADDGEMTDVLKDFITKVQSKTALYLETKGNHDRHPYNYQG